MTCPILYTALFVEDTESLIKMFPPKHTVIYAHHSTISFKPQTLDGIEVGRKTIIKILGRAFDEKGDALLVENKKSKNKFPHITLSCAEGVQPYYSNELLETAYKNNKIEYFQVPIEISSIESYIEDKP